MPEPDDLRAKWGRPAASPSPAADGVEPSARPSPSPPANAPLLEGVDVVRSYPGAQGVLAVRGASLALASRDFVALMGPSGSGKTTFIGALSGLDAPDEGEVRWKGEPIGSMSRAAR
jgi:ABC-type glutathione transport system ATPase component